MSALLIRLSGWQQGVNKFNHGTDKSDGKRRNTLGCLEQYTCNVETVKQDHETVQVYKYVQRMETMKQSRLWSTLGTHASLVVMWRLYISRSGETRKFDVF